MKVTRLDKVRLRDHNIIRHGDKQTPLILVLILGDRGRQICQFEASLVEISSSSLGYTVKSHL